MARKSRKELIATLRAGTVPEKAQSAAVEEAPRQYNAGAYARLSVLETRDKKDSEALQNQKALLREYIAEHPELRLAREYEDNGETGTNFEREGFQSLIEDVRRGLIDCIVVKDLSRFGRDHVEVEHYLQHIFPHLGVRFIAISDGYDSADASTFDRLTVALKNIVNNIYSKDISLKSGGVLREKQARGEFIGAYASYGPAVITRAVVHAAGPYEVPNVRIDATFYYTNNPMAGAFIEVLPDASVNLMVGCADIGQGSTSAMAQIAAEELGLEYEDIRVTPANTQVTPEGGATSASRQTFISGSATMLAARMAKKTLAEVASKFLNVPEEKLIFKHREVYSADDASVKMTYIELMNEMKRLGKLALGCGAYNPRTTGLNPDNMFGIPFEVYSYAATIVDLEVDVETGLVDVLNVISAHDVGTAVNKQAVEGQIEGGVAMGIGFALLEKIETKNGKITNPVFSKYLLATDMDAPEIYPIVVESGTGETGPFGAKGVGEPALIPTIPATADAVENALNIRFGKLPIQHLDIMRELYKK